MARASFSRSGAEGSLVQAGRGAIGLWAQRDDGGGPLSAARQATQGSADALGGCWERRTWNAAASGGLGGLHRALCAFLAHLTTRRGLLRRCAGKRLGRRHRNPHQTSSSSAVRRCSAAVSPGLRARRLGRSRAAGAVIGVCKRITNVSRCCPESRPALGGRAGVGGQAQDLRPRP